MSLMSWFGYVNKPQVSQEKHLKTTYLSPLSWVDLACRKGDMATEADKMVSCLGPRERTGPTIGSPITLYLLSKGAFQMTLSWTRPKLSVALKASSSWQHGFQVLVRLLGACLGEKSYLAFWVTGSCQRWAGKCYVLCSSPITLSAALA